MRSSKSGDRLTSLDQYILRMKPDQKQIYYLAGANKKLLEQSPFVEKLLKNGYEVRTHSVLHSSRLNCISIYPEQLTFYLKAVTFLVGICQVIYLTDAVDEYLTQNLTEYEEKKFQNASKEDLKLGSRDEKAELKEMKESYKDLTKWWVNLLSDEMVESVRVGAFVHFLPNLLPAIEFFHQKSLWSCI